MGQELSNIRSPLHPVVLSKGRLSLQPGLKVPDNDIYLFFKFQTPISKAFPVECHSSGKNAHFLMAGVVPAYDELLSELESDSSEEKSVHTDDSRIDDSDPVEILFVVDTHQQSPIETLIHGLQCAFDFLKGTSRQIYFNLIVLGEESEFLFRRSVELSEDSLKQASKFVGGSQFQKAFSNKSNQNLSQTIQLVYNLDVVSEEIPRVILLFTRSQISRPTNLIFYVDSRRDDFQIFPISFSQGDKYVLRTLAQTTTGHAELLSLQFGDSDEWQKPICSAVERQLHRILQPYPDKVIVDWGDLGAVLQFPSVIDFRVSSGDLCVFYGIFREEVVDTEIVLTVIVGNHSKEFIIPVNSKKNCTQEKVVQVLATSEHYLELLEERETNTEPTVRAHLQSKCEELAIKNSIATADTSFFGYVEEDKTCVCLVSSTDFDFQEVEEAPSVLRYSAAFLMSFMEENTEKPENFPDIFVPKEDVILPQKAVRSSEHSTSRTPEIGKSTSIGSSRRKQVSKPRAAPPVQREKKTVIKTQWEEENLDSKNSEELFRTSNSLLNKLTRDNFQKIVEQLIALKPKIGTVTELEVVVKQVSEKAINAPRFASMYADLCSALKEALPKFNREGTIFDFRRILLELCQHEFEKEPSVPGAILDQEKEFRKKERMTGHITFVGALYKSEILKANIIHRNILSVLLSHEEDQPPASLNVEITCKLLTTIGQHLEYVDDSSHQYLDHYFEYLTALSSDTRLEAKIRFGIKDLIDLRKKDWVPRGGVKVEPKTIQECHEDLENQKLEKERTANQLRRLQSQEREKNQSRNSPTLERRGYSGDRTASPSMGDRYARSGGSVDSGRRPGYPPQSPRQGESLGQSRDGGSRRSSQSLERPGHSGGGGSTDRNDRLNQSADRYQRSSTDRTNDRSPSSSTPPSLSSSRGKK